MQAYKLTSLRQMALMEVPTPEIRNATDVLVKMARVGVCGSDVHYYETGQIGSQVVQYPFTVGHEGAGVVAATGPAATRVKVGDRIAVEPAMPCHTCDQCRAGRPHTCRQLRFLGCPGQAEGCLSEYLVMPEGSCFPIPDGMTLDEAALSEPLAIGVYAVKQSVPIAGARIGILGAGPIGLSVLLPALAQGAAAAYVTDKIPARLAVARRAGAAWTGNPLETDIVQEIAAAEPLLLDAVFECCGDQAAVDQALRLLKPGGKLMLIGIPPTLEKYGFSVDLMRRKEICVQNVRRQNHCVQTALDLIRDHAFDVTRMLTHRFPFRDTPRAFDLVANYRDGVVKAMIDI